MDGIPTALFVATVEASGQRARCDAVAVDWIDFSSFT
jgi:hypothetical protein